MDTSLPIYTYQINLMIQMVFPLILELIIFLEYFVEDQNTGIMDDDERDMYKDDILENNDSFEDENDDFDVNLSDKE